MQSFESLCRPLAFVLSLAALLQGTACISDATAQEPRREMTSWVVLFDSDVGFTEDSLRAELDRLWPGEFLPKRDNGSFVVEGNPPGAQFMIKSGLPGASGVFLLHNVPAPYSEFSDMVGRIPDPSLRDIAKAQGCWMSVDRISQSDEAEAYTFIGRVLARLAPPDAAVLLHPSRRTAVRFTEDVRRQLADKGRPE
jgi:hypothetical protein